MSILRFRHGTRRKALMALPTALALALTAACGSSGGSASTQPAADALSTPVTLTFWTWAPAAAPTVKLFEKAHPNIKINLVNVGQGPTEYTKLATAMKSGSGAPDVAQIEYFALPQFVLSKDVVDLTGYGASSLQSQYTKSAWAQVAIDGGIYGYPQDTGPLVMFYRTDVFKKLGLSAPTTWAEYQADAVKIHQANPADYIGMLDPSDAGTLDSLVWQAGGTPFKVTDSTTVSTDLSSPAAAKVANLWGSMVQQKLVNVTAAWSTDWWKAMGAGTYATWIAGAWGSGAIGSSIPQTDEDWAAAPIPQWSAGENVSAENGGSSVAVMSSSAHKAAAAAFAQWLDTDPTATASLTANGLFPATTALLGSASFQSTPIAALNGQQANKVFADSSANVAPGWQYLPFQVYANSVFGDTVGQAETGGTSLAGGFTAWQKDIDTYASQQGFTVGNG